MGKNTVEAKQWLDKHYGDSVPGISTIIDWYAEFKHGRTSTDDVERSGRPQSAVVPKKIKKKNVHKIVLKDRKMKLREIADTLKISECSVFTLLHENLGMRKLLSKWVQRLLTPDQKQ
ncbi:Protein GVQW3 like protein [Argiope bruennichi]|uniref:Protein GVQW3 like protein n=1 Tax=Argiope bruennichi TaxID=94029 RepID=A0A8T0F1U6_ARGBR|nr:Protein GVQW3 like protein [Argiope bruennichi]